MTTSGFAFTNLLINAELPCFESGGIWLSEDSKDRREAKIKCGECKIIGACYDFGVRIGATHGVYGAHDFTKILKHSPKKKDQCECVRCVRSKAA